MVMLMRLLMIIMITTRRTYRYQWHEIILHRAGCYKTHCTWQQIHPPRQMCWAPDRFGLGDWLHQLDLITWDIYYYWIIIGNLSRNLPEFLGMKTVVYKELQIFSQDKLGRLLTSTIWDQNKHLFFSVSGVWIAKIFHFMQFLQWFHVISVYNAIAFKHSQQLASGHGFGCSLVHWFWPNNCGKTWQLDKI